MNSVSAVLNEKRSALMSDLARLKDEAREAGAAAVRDWTDTATSAQSSGEALQEVTLESQTLEQVEDALRRVADGTNGKCSICGREIGAARLKALPWTPYCLDDQQKADQLAAG